MSEPAGRTEVPGAAGETVRDADDLPGLETSVV